MGDISVCEIGGIDRCCVCRQLQALVEAGAKVSSSHRHNGYFMRHNLDKTRTVSLSSHCTNAHRHTFYEDTNSYIRTVSRYASISSGTMRVEVHHSLEMQCSLKIITIPRRAALLLKSMVASSPSIRKVKGVCIVLYNTKQELIQ